ncbi:MAG: murein L,D-transpeptidase, partial [Roseovarius sp.]|nr:murein L,D-transpeptidase [Roseovarius sp.]
MTLAFCHPRSRELFRIVPVMLTAALVLFAWIMPAAAQEAAFRQAVAEAAAEDRDLAAFYQDQSYRPVWTGAGAEHIARRQALVQVLARAGVHGLPAERYDLDGLIASMTAARSQRDLGQVEVALSRTYLRYAHDVQSGVLVPSAVIGDIKREVVRRESGALLEEILA